VIKQIEEDLRNGDKPPRSLQGGYVHQRLVWGKCMGKKVPVNQTVGLISSGTPFFRYFFTLDEVGFGWGYVVCEDL